MSTVPNNSKPDLLAGATLASLTRPIYFPLSWRVLPAFLATAFTAGILPNLKLPMWLKGVIAQHELQTWHLAEWLRLNIGGEETLRLQNASRRIHYYPALATVSILCSIIAMTVLGVHLYQNGWSRGSVLGFVYAMPHTPMMLVFALMISTAATINWLHLLIHQKNFAEYIATFDDFAKSNGMEAIPLPPIELGVRPLWIIAAVGIAFSGATWGIPVMLAMAAHRRYTMRTSVRMRAQLAERMRSILDRQTPALQIPRHPMTVLRTCIRPTCRSPLTYAARFCPRCGTRIAESVDVVG